MSPPDKSSTRPPARWEIEAAQAKARDERHAEQSPQGDALACRLHERRHRRGQTLYSWDQMQPEYRMGERSTMQLVLDMLLSDDAIEVVAARRRNGHPDDGSDCDHAVWQDARGDVWALVNHLTGKERAT